MTAATVTFGSLPRATTLTDVLLAPAADPLTTEELSSVRSLLRRDVAQATRDLERPGPMRIDPYRVRALASAVSPPELPFEWNPWTARRPLGLEAVRTCLGRPRLSPLEAARDTIDRLVRRSKEDASAGTLADWLAGLPLGGRSVVQAEAALWATQLLSALEWQRPATRLVGFDRSVVPCESPRVIVRGRLDVELRPARPPDGEPRDPAGGVLVMMTGHPLPSARLELALSALTAALSDRPGAVPARIVGYWPQCGRALELSIDLDLLLRGCQAVVDAVRDEAERSPRLIRKRRGEDRRAFAPPVLDERAAS